MNIQAVILTALGLVTTAALVRGDLRRRAGRGTPTTRVRTRIGRRPAPNTTPEQQQALLRAGFAAHIVGPLLARAATAVGHCDHKRARLQHAVARHARATAELDGYSERLGDQLDGVRPTNARWHRYTLYAFVLAVDIATGFIVATGLNDGLIQSFGYGASVGLALFFLGKLAGTGLRRLDLTPGRAADSVGIDNPDIGQRRVSWAMLAAGLVGIALVIGAIAASRHAADAITTAAETITQSQAVEPTTTVTPPEKDWWQLLLISSVALGGFTATAFMAMRSHPATRRLEELEARAGRSRTAAQKHIQPLGAAVTSASRSLALLDAALVERAARVGAATGVLDDQLEDAAAELHQRHQRAMDLLDVAASVDLSVPLDEVTPHVDLAADDDNLAKTTGAEQRSVRSNGVLR